MKIDKWLNLLFGLVTLIGLFICLVQNNQPTANINALALGLALFGVGAFFLLAEVKLERKTEEDEFGFQEEVGDGKP